MPFIDQVLERLANFTYFCYLDGLSGFYQIPIHPEDQAKTTFTCPYGTFVFRRVYAMHPQLFKNACFQYLVIYLIIV